MSQRPFEMFKVKLLIELLNFGTFIKFGHIISGYGFLTVNWNAVVQTTDDDMRESAMPLRTCILYIYWGV